MSDNVNGLNEANFKSFQEVYSQLTVKKGCKKEGRFLWLKVFEKYVFIRWLAFGFSFFKSAEKVASLLRTKCSHWKKVSELHGL